MPSTLPLTSGLDRISSFDHTVAKSVMFRSKDCEVESELVTRRSKDIKTPMPCDVLLVMCLGPNKRKLTASGMDRRSAAFKRKVLYLC